jgi:CRISPR-associated protein Csm2
MNFESEFKNNKWITEGMDEKGVKFAEEFGLHLCDKRTAEDKFVGRTAMTTSQIRNVFGEVKRIQAKAQGAESFQDYKSDFYLLRPKIAYAEAKVLSKTQDSRIRDFRKIMEFAHKEVKDDKENFQRFVDFFEAILAYHKFYGGRD